VHADPKISPQEHARHMFQRVITGWAMDALALRRSGLDRPCVRTGSGLWVSPGRMRVVREHEPEATHAIRWRPPKDLAA
jgi:hypothetical protein